MPDNLYDQVAETFSDFITRNVPTSGAKEPKKSETRATLYAMIGAIIDAAGAALGQVARATKAQLDAVTPDDDGTIGSVWADGDPDKNGVYKYQTSAWVLTDIPLTSVISASLSALTDRVTDVEASASRECGPFTPAVTDDTGAGFPTTGGTGSGGAIVVGNVFTAAADGFVNTRAVKAGDAITAIVNTPGQTEANWRVGGVGLGYTPFDVANLIATLSGSPSSSQVLNAAALKATIDGIDTAKFNVADILTSLAGTLTNNQVLGASALKTTVDGINTSKADKTVTVTGGGLATGGGDLTANRTVIVTKASSSDVTTGTDDTKAMTPLSAQPRFGALETGAAKQVTNFPLDGTARDGKAFVPLIKNLAGKLIASIERVTGRLVFFGWWDKEVAVSRPRNSRKYLWAIKFTDGRVLLGAKINGAAYLGVDATEAQRIVTLGGGATTGVISTLRDGRVVRSKVTVGSFDLGVVSGRNGFDFNIKQLSGGSNAVAVPDDPRPMGITLCYGQSNAGYGGSQNVNRGKILAALFPSHALGFAVSGTSHFFSYAQSGTDNTAVINDLLPLSDAFASAGWPQSLMTMFGSGIEMSYRAQGGVGPGVICHTDWWGGQPIDTFVKGTDAYTNLIAHVTRATAMATLYGRTSKCSSILFIQGENGPFDGTYQTKLDQLVTDLRTDIQAATSQASPPAIMVFQTNLSDTDGVTSNADVPLNQLAVCAARPTQAVMVGPMYFSRLTDQGIHCDAESRMMQGEIAGEVYRRIADGTGWLPLWSTAISRTTNVISITYNLPGDDMEFDPGTGQAGDGWVKPVTNYGFFYADDSSGVTISSVALAKDAAGKVRKVTVTLSGDPGSATGKTLTYAHHAYNTTADFWSTTRGQLRSRLRASEYRRLGYLVPEFVYAYACQERWTSL